VKEIEAGDLENQKGDHGNFDVVDNSAAYPAVKTQPVSAIVAQGKKHEINAENDPEILPLEEIHEKHLTS